MIHDVSSPSSHVYPSLSSYESGGGRVPIVPFLPPTAPPAAALVGIHPFHEAVNPPPPPTATPLSPANPHHHSRRHRHRRCSWCYCAGLCCWCGFGKTIRILSHVLSLVPIFASFAMMSTSNLSFGMANVAAIVVGVACLLLDFVLFRKRLTRVFPKQLGVANICFSTLASILAFTTSDVVMKQWSASLTLSCLSVMLLVGIVIKRPLKLEQYQDLVPRSVWNSDFKRPILVDLAKRSTIVYLVAFVTMAIINIIIAACEQCPVDGNCTLQNSSLAPLLLHFFVPLIVMATAHNYIGKWIPSWQQACEYDEEQEKQKRRQKKLDKLKTKANYNSSNNIQSYHQSTAGDSYLRDDADDDDDDDEDESDDEVDGENEGARYNSNQCTNYYDNKV